MKVQYIGHSGFLVTLESCYLLFDYYTGEIPQLSCDKPLYIFSSHRHEDHFNPAIFSFAGLTGQVEYLLSYDIKLNRHFFSKYPDAADLQEKGKLHSLRMEERYVIDNLEIHTLKSTDEGIAFLVSVLTEQKLIYHAGDLNWWVWPEDTKQEYNSMTSMFQRAVGQLAELVEHGGSGKEHLSGKEAETETENRSGRVLDAAFLPLDPRQEEYEFYGMEYYLEHVPMKHVFPMHFWDQYDIISRFVRTCADRYPETQIQMITEKGACYEI